MISYPALIPVDISEKQPGVAAVSIAIQRPDF